MSLSIYIKAKGFDFRVAEQGTFYTWISINFLSDGIDKIVSGHQGYDKMHVMKITAE